jgi:choline dehydrogenase-like flavoprotein
LLREAVRFASRVARTEPLSNMIVAQTEPSPTILEDDTALDEYIKANLETAHHPVGTAAMMPREFGGMDIPVV